jgi:hypothetical protein
MDRLTSPGSPLAGVADKAARATGHRLGVFHRLDEAIDAHDWGALFERVFVGSMLVAGALVLALHVLVWMASGAWPHLPIGIALSSLGIELEGLGQFLPEWQLATDSITALAKMPVWAVALIPFVVLVFRIVTLRDIVATAVILTFPAGLLVLAGQSYVWARTGAWHPVPVAAALPFLGVDPSTIHEPSGWIGLARAAAWVLDLPLSSVALVLPVASLIFGVYVAFLYRFILDPLSEFRVDIQTCQARAEGGDPVYQNDLGYAFERGALGLPQDYVRAHMWYNLAAANHPAGELRDGSARNRDRLTRRMTGAQIAEAQALARNMPGPRG